MSGLRSAIDDFTGVLHGRLTVEELDEALAEAADGIRRLEVFMARAVGELGSRAGHRRLGHSSPTAYLMHRAVMSAGRARRIVADAHAAERAPDTFRAWADGRLSSDQARRVFALAETVPDVFPDAEEALVEIVEPLSVSDTARALEYWRQAVDGPGELSVGSQLARRGLSVSKTMGGMRKVDGWLTPTAGEALEAGLRAFMAPPGPDDTRTPRQRRHDALEDLARWYLDHGDTPQVGGERPHVMVLADLEALQGIAGGTHETLDGQILDVETIRMIACDSSVSRIVLGPDSEVLDIGRKTRVWTAAQRRAIVARDRHCTAPGCERPPHWCDIHHEDHWADGGHTSVAKGRLLCRFHHFQEHIRQARKRRRRRIKR